jgi:N,N'-diacetyllegionaminate synthase
LNKVVIIAEAGVNHNGDLEKAIQLIELAANAGADYIKFQTFITELNISKDAQKASYQISNTGEKETQFEMVKKLELSFNDFVVLKRKCEDHNIQFLSTGFDIPSIDFLDSLNPPFYKIPSGEITNKPFLKHIAKKGKDIILSTGMATISEIKQALEVFQNEGISKERITVLHCNTEYPTPMQDVNLLAMNHIAKELEVKVGYSDHTLGIEVPIAAVALGAQVIEKHFTLDRTLPGPDHIASLEPNELKAMVSAIRNIEQAISGNGLKSPSQSEFPNLKIARKSIHINQNLSKGHVLKADDLVMKRPGDGISPMDIEKIIGKKLKIDLKQETKLIWDHII